MNKKLAGILVALNNCLAEYKELGFSEVQDSANGHHIRDSYENLRGAIRDLSSIPELRRTVAMANVRLFPVTGNFWDAAHDRAFMRTEELPFLNKDMLTFMAASEKIKAIKAYRERFGYGLAESKNACEQGWALFVKENGTEQEARLAVFALPND